MDHAWNLFETWVAAHGGRQTEERRQLFKVVKSMPVTFSLAEVVDKCEQLTIEGCVRVSRPTVYNTLEAFVQAGLLDRLHVRGTLLYVRTEGQQAVVVTECTECGRVDCIKPGGVAEAVAHLAYRRFTPVRSLTLVHGLCSRCESALKKESKRKTNIQ